MRIINPYAIILFFAIILISVIIGSSLVLNPSKESLASLNAAPEQVSVENRMYRLETYLWRDFMPISPPDGKPLIAVVKVLPNDSLKFPANIDADHLWVVNGQEIWSTSFSDEEVPQDEYILEKIARDGPKWDPGISVDVIVRLVVNDHNTYLLKAPNQTIHRTD
ncbi:MAG: hypothetical protein ACFE95_00030 [Candidatus Hodarchaeota archaeon]